MSAMTRLAAAAAAMLLLAGICLGGIMFGFLDTVYSIRNAVAGR